jgi:hypothetical protein
VVLRFSQGDVDTAIRRQRCRAHHEKGRNLRSAIEATIGAIKRGFGHDRLPVRGTSMMNAMLIGSAAMVNVQRNQLWYTAHRRTQGQEGRNDDGSSLLFALELFLTLETHRLASLSTQTAPGLDMSQGRRHAVRLLPRRAICGILRVEKPA